MKKFRVVVNGTPYEVEVEELGGETAAPSAPVLRKAPPVAQPPIAAPAPAAAPPAPAGPAPAAGPVDGAAVTAPLPGLIVGVRVQPGQRVEAGQTLVVLEAMKMENDIVAPSSGTVKEVRVEKGQTVALGDVLVVLG